MKRFLFILFFTQISFAALPQALPIYIDGTFNDWENAQHFVEDEQSGGAEIDFLKFTVTNDNDFLFIKLEFSEEIDLTDNNEIYLDIDADNNPATGWQVNGIGSEMDWNFGQKFGYLNEGNPWPWEYIYFADIQLRLLPTVTSNIFEIAIGRHVKPNGVDYLFTGDTIKLCFTNDITNGDNIPNEGEFFTYVFDNTYVQPAEPTLLQKEDEDLIRLMAYNIQNDFENNIGGLDDPERIPSLERIFTSISPDIITMNECWNTSKSTAQNFLNTNLPTGNVMGWYANKLDGANITASRYPIIDSWRVHPDQRITACLVDLPDKYKQNLLVISAHFKCCDDDETRQMEADAFVSFILDAKTPGGVIDLPENTPFVLMGDLNLVGLSQQLKTLLYGDIQDTNTFGLAAPPDWDDSDLADLISRQTDKRMAYTWRHDEGSYPPGRLDYMIFSNSVMGVEKAFTLQTEVMPLERLELYGLAEFDTRTSSDHFPKVADFELEESMDIEGFNKPVPAIEVYPNPAGERVNIKADIKISSVWIYNHFSQIMLRKNPGTTQLQMNVSDLITGLYLLKVETEQGSVTKRIVIQ